MNSTCNHLLRKALTEIEDILESHLNNVISFPNSDQTLTTENENLIDEGKDPFSLPFSEEFLLRLASDNPVMFERIMMEHYKNKNLQISS